MGRLIKRALTGIVLTLLPPVAVFSVKHSAWGPALATPKTRIFGEPDAKLMILEYSDFQCPSCASVQPTLHTLMDVYKGKIRLAYKYYPLTKIHKNAMPAAHAAVCAEEQKKFWPYHDRLFSSQTAWSNLADPTTSFVAIARDVQMDTAKFNTCFAEPSKRKPIEADMEDARRREINSTPTFFIDDERLVGGVFASDAARTIEKVLRRK